jgi:site-specific DNA recombinase
VTNGSAGQWLSGTMLGAVSEYQRRTTAERTREAQVRAVARGVAPYPVPPGYIRGEDGVFEPDPDTAPIVAEAFAMRARGAPITDVRSRLAVGGIERSWHGVSDMLASRHVLGEIHYGDLVNLEAHEPIVDVETWKRVQRVHVPKGRKPKTNRLLGGLKILKCGTCRSNMRGGFAHNGEYSMYRCPKSECERRVTISTRLADEAVTGEVRAAIADAEGRASAESKIAGAAADLDHAQAELDAALRVLVDFSDEPGARDRLEALRAERDAAQDRLDRIGGTEPRSRFRL